MLEIKISPRLIAPLPFVLFTATLFAVSATRLAAQTSNGETRGWWPQKYAVHEDAAAGKLVLSTPYYTIVHDLKKGGVIGRIHLTHGQADNLLVTPMRAGISLLLTNELDKPDADEHTRRITGVYSDANDPAPTVTYTNAGDVVTVTVASALRGEHGEDSGVRTETTYAYHWGYVKIHKVFIAPAAGARVRQLSVLSTVLDPSLSDYGYRPGPSEEMGSDFNGWQAQEIRAWGKIRPGTHFDLAFQTRYVPLYLVLANPGVEGIEWFPADDLSQWDFQMSGQTGTSYCKLSASTEPLGIAMAIDPFNISHGYNLPRGGWTPFNGRLTFDYYLAVPILEGHAQALWLNRDFSPNRGNWISEDYIKRSAADGVTTMCLHNDGDFNGDGLYWRDGSYPPYPPAEMKKMDQIIAACHRSGIKVAPYFSNHELSQSTAAFKEHGEEWGRKVDDQGTLRPNYYYGALMCLKSGWLDYFEHGVDRVLKDHPFDGVYYDWDLAMYCNNPLHVGKLTNGVSGARGLGALAVSPTGHWDIDEFLSLIEWTRQRVGPDGLVLLHNTLAPMFATENFASSVVGMEFGYGELSVSMPKPDELPLEWNFAGARSRAVIGYGTIAAQAPPRLHRDFALTALLTSVAPWPAIGPYIQLHKILTPLGDLENYQFADWRNPAVKLDDANCRSAIYSRAGEAYVLIANLGAKATKVRCAVSPDKLPNPLAAVKQAEALTVQGTATPLDAAALTGAGEELSIPADDLVLLRLR